MLTRSTVQAEFTVIFFEVVRGPAMATAKIRTWSRKDPPTPLQISSRANLRDDRVKDSKATSSIAAGC